jgi:hypothetical protein
VGALLSFGAWWLVRMSEKRALLFLLGVFAVAMVVTLWISQVQMDTPTNLDGGPKVIFPERAKAPARRKKKR